MSLATDILARAFREPVNLVATPRQRKQTKRGKIQMPEVPKRKHCFRTGSRWYARVKLQGGAFYLGSYDTESRASVASKLFLLWSRRYPLNGIPVYQKGDTRYEAEIPDIVSAARIQGALLGKHELTTDELQSVLTEVLSRRL